MNKKELQIIALSKSITAPENYVMVLEEETTQKRIPIIIGQAEAQYIGIVLENLKTKKPLTHGLLYNIVEILQAKIEYVIINGKTDEMFHSDIVIKNKDGASFNLDARISDAVAIALRADVPIYIDENLLNYVGSNTEIYDKSNKVSFTDYNLKELEELLQRVIEKEDFESAIRIREAIKKHLDNK